VRSRLFMTTALAGIAGAIRSGTSRVTLRFDVKRGLSLRCWIFGHEDWVRRVPGGCISNVSTVEGDTGMDNVPKPV